MIILGKYYRLNDKFLEIIHVDGAIDNSTGDLGFIIYLDGEKDGVFIKYMDLGTAIVDTPYPYGRSGAI